MPHAFCVTSGTASNALEQMPVYAWHAPLCPGALLVREAGVVCQGHRRSLSWVVFI
jgi:hypothetical protein